MGDDFDLFPKRENLDPFSFGTQEKKNGIEEGADDLFGQEETPPPLPDLPLGNSDAGGQEGKDVPASPEASPQEPPPDQFKLPQQKVPIPKPDGPISEEKTFDEPVLTAEPEPKKAGKKKKNAPSPFVVVGGALVIILGLLYGALTFLKRDVPPAQPIAPPVVSVAVEPVNLPEPTSGEPAADSEPTFTPSASSTPPSEPKPALVPLEKPEPAAPESVAAAQTVPPVSATAVLPVEGGRYSVQVGALILESGVRELEKRVATLGYETFLKMGSTTAMMNMLTVGPFPTTDEARKALSLLRESGIDSNLARRAGGGAVINAGSYLLEENASGIRSKIRSMGYPVDLSRKKVKLPMTFVRVGHFEKIDEANRTRDELKGKGLDAIVVKLP